MKLKKDNAMIQYLKNHPIKVSFFLFTIFIFIAISLFVEPALYFHEMQPPFLANHYFFSEFLRYPGGISEYVANFTAQFFYSGWGGTVIICFFGFAVLIAGYYFIRKTKLPPVFTILWGIPYLFFSVQFTNYHFPLSSAIEILLSLIFAIIFWELAKKINLILIFPLLAILLYYLSDNGSFAIFTFLSSLIVFHNYGTKKGILFLVLSFAFYIISSYLTFKYICNISFNRLWFNFIPDSPIHLLFLPGKLFYTFIFSVPVIFLITLISAKLLSEKITSILANKQLIISLLFSLALVSSGFVLFQKNLDLKKKNIILSDYYCYTENWDKVISIALQDKEYNVLINTNYNRALDHSGLLYEKFFDYPQLLGPGILYPDLLRTSEMAMLSSDIYYDLGYISESLHWAHEAQTSQPYNIRILQRLVILNLINGNIRASCNYLNVLQDNFLAKNFVKKYNAYFEDTTLIFKDREIAEKRTYSPKGKVVGNIESKLLDLVTQNKSNKRAWDYLQLYYLLDHDLNDFMKNLPTWKKFYITNPGIMDESILLYLYQSKQMKNLDGYSKVEISKLSDYLRTLNMFDNDVAAAKSTLAINYSNTYMFYLMYNSPRVTNISYSAEDVTNYNR
jgi:hypothetical protein